MRCAIEYDDDDDGAGLVVCDIYSRAGGWLSCGGGI